MLSVPRVVECARPENLTYSPVIDLKTSNISRPACFKLPRIYSGIPVTADILGEIFLSDTLVLRVAQSSNAFIEKRLTPEQRQAQIAATDVLQFFAIMYYMGIVRLPCKYDLWSTNDEMPQHALATEHGMTRDRFKCIWRNIYFISDAAVEDPDEEEASDEDETETDIVQNEALPADENDGDNGGDEVEDREIEFGSSTDVDNYIPVWFSKIKPLTEHIRRVSQSLCIVPGFCLSIDEMMMRFCGRSGETHRMKNRPITEGFKFFVLVDAKTGFVCHFVPDGRLASHRHTGQAGGGNEYSASDGTSKTAAMIKHLLNGITELRATHGHEFVVAMDNYFTHPGVMPMLREMGIGCVGTSRPKRGWPPSELRVPNSATFNDFYWCVDDRRTFVAQWYDHNIVLLVSTVHMPLQHVRRPRRRPRRTATNKDHIHSVWVSSAVTPITIPRIVDDYNHWMGGVDLADQQIAYYSPDATCRRTWMPMMLQCLNIIGNNICVVYQQLSNEKPTSDFHKKLSFQLLASLPRHARASFLNMNGGNTRGRRESNGTPTADEPPQKVRRLKMSTSNPQLPLRRLQRPVGIHQRVVSKRQEVCRYCAYRRAMHIKTNPQDVDSAPRVRNPYAKCDFCNAHLCKGHFDPYH